MNNTAIYKAAAELAKTNPGKAYDMLEKAASTQVFDPDQREHII